MSEFMSDFGIFFNSILGSVQTLWQWLISTVFGQIITFTIIISLFLTVIFWIIDFKN